LSGQNKTHKQIGRGENNLNILYLLYEEVEYCIPLSFWDLLKFVK